MTDRMTRKEAQALPQEVAMSDDLVTRLNKMATEIDEDWAADIQEGGNSPRPVNTPGEAAAEITRLNAVIAAKEKQGADLFDAAFKGRWFVNEVAQGATFSDIGRANAKDVCRLLDAALARESTQTVGGPDGFTRMHFEGCDYFKTRGRSPCSMGCCS